MLDAGIDMKGAAMARSRTLLILALGSTLGFIGTATGPAIAAKVSSFVRGGGNAGGVQEPRFIYRTNNGELQFVDVERSLLKIPHEYGEPFAVTSQDGAATVWYRSEKLGVRNVVVMTANRQPVHILQTEPITKKKSEERLER